jgi:peroxiredoxin
MPWLSSLGVALACPASIHRQILPLSRILCHNSSSTVVLLVVNSPWCEGCQVEIPWFVEFEKKYADRGFTVVGVSLDSDGWKSVRPWLMEKKVNYTSLATTTSAKQYALDGMPFTALIDRDGKIAYVHAGIVSRATDQKLCILLQPSCSTHTP